MNPEIAVIVTNSVQTEIVNELNSREISCIVVNTSGDKYTKDFLSGCKRVVLPFPSTLSNLSFVQGVETLSEYFSAEQTVIGGMIRDNVKEEIERTGAKVCDYFENEAYVLKNAQLTSQGAVRLLLENTDKFLVGKKVLITGFGRIGKSLALMLKSLGMKVYVTVRREEAAVKANAYGLEVLSYKALKGSLFYFDFIFNTVPSTLFYYKDISHIRNDARYFELASSPFGAEKKDFVALGKNYVHAGALPGRFYPQAVAKNIVDFILETGR